MQSLVTFLVLLPVFLIHYVGYSQVHVGSEEMLKIYTAGDISKSEFERKRRHCLLCNPGISMMKQNSEKQLKNSGL